VAPKEIFVEVRALNKNSVRSAPKHPGRRRRPAR
jgi:hypothetical protein